MESQFSPRYKSTPHERHKLLICQRSRFNDNNEAQEDFFMDEKRKDVLRQSMFIRFGISALAAAALLYFFARDYWQGWLYWIVLFVPMFFVVLYFSNRDPDFLERRTRYKEKEREQASIVVAGTVIMLVGLAIIGLDRYYSWSTVPPIAVIVANAVSFIGYSIIFLTFRENGYASHIIEVEKSQKVISSGPYAIIRHPMYLGYILMMLSMPVALGSWVGVPFYSLHIPLIIARILNEEKVLSRDLPGYVEYCVRTRHRLVPGIW